MRCDVLIKLLNKVTDNRKQSIKTALSVVFFSLLFMALFSPLRVFAKGDIHSGSEEYRNDYGNDFNVGIYIGADETDTFKNYRVELEYNPLYVHFINGDVEENSGKIVLEGTSEDGNSVREMLLFRPVMGGVTHLDVISAIIKDINDNELDVEESLKDSLIIINAPLCEAPASVDINGKKLDLEQGIVEYSISIPYSNKINLLTSSDYVVITNKDELKEGFNQVKVLFGKPAMVPLEYTFNISVEKEEKPVLPQDEEVEEPAEEDLKTILRRQAEETETDPEIKALNLKSATIQKVDNEDELREERLKSILIVLIFGISIVLILLGKVIYEVINNSKIGIVRERRFTGKRFFGSKEKSGKLTFESINAKRTISEQYFVDGLDIKINDIVDKDKKNANKK